MQTTQQKSVSHFRPLRNESRQLDVAVINAAERQSLLAVRALGLSGLKVGAFEIHKNAPAFSSRWCAATGLLPDFFADQDAFFSGVLELIDRYEPKVILPAHDGAIDAIDRRRRELPTITRLALPSSSALEIATDKVKTNAVATDIGIRIPRSVHLTSSTQVGDALAEMGLPVVVKPIRSWVQQESSATRLVSQLVVSPKQAVAVIDGAFDKGSQVLLQEWIPGAREAVWLFYAHGHFWARFAQVAHRMRPILGGASVLRESIPLSEDTLSAAERLVSTVGIEGFSEVEFRRDRNGAPVLMEINPRLSASVEVAFRSGVDFLALIYAWGTDQKLWNINGYKHGVRMRWLGGDLLWLTETLQSQGLPDALPSGKAIRAFCIDSARSDTGYDYLGFSDVKPALVASVGAVRSVIRRLSSRD